MINRKVTSALHNLKLVNNIYTIFFSFRSQINVYIFFNNVRKYESRTSYSSGLLISHTTLRLCDPHCQQEKGWTDEPLAQQTVRATKLLYNTAVESETSKAKCSRFPAFTFAFFFNLLNAVLRGGASVVKGDNSVCTLALQLICEHGKLKYDVEQGEQVNYSEQEVWAL